MTIFPEVKPSWGYACIPQFKNERLGPTDGDYTQRRRLRSIPLYLAKWTYESLSAADERTVMEFFEARSGGWDNFVFYDFDSLVYSGVSVGTGDGVTTVFTMAARDITDETVYVDGTPTAVTVGVRAGANGQDQITFAIAPGDTLAITADYTGQRYLPICVFDDDELAAAINYQRYRIAKVVVRQVNG
jgi:hypothetical protein